MIRPGSHSFLTLISLLCASSVWAQEPIRGFPVASWAAQHARERQAREIPDADHLREYMTAIASEPHHAGSAGSLRVAEYIRDQLIGWGLDAEIEPTESLLPYPTLRTLEMIAPESYTLSLTEPPIASDPDTTDNGQLPTFNAFSDSGDVTGELIYVNYGMATDYEYLESQGIDVTGKIVIARYGEGWRGLKARLAEEHGALGTIIYSDPHDDGYFADDAYPNGEARPAGGVQRGSVVGMEIYPGDPLTPGWESAPGADRLRREEAANLLHTPVLPISWSEAQPLLEQLEGPVAPEYWRGALPITYHVGPGPAQVHLAVDFDWTTKPLYNVIATLPGTEFPDQWILYGNHHDAWVNGASDPTSGTAALMETARALGELYADGWRPKRTIKLAFWDGEEYGLIGSTEWVEKHFEELDQKGAVYINSDSNGSGEFGVSGSHALEPFVNEVMRDVQDPGSGVSILQHIRAEQSPQSTDDNRPVRIGALGAGSDYVAFLHHAGIASLNLGFMAERGQYHSIYDTVTYYDQFSDTDRSRGVALSQFTTTSLLRLADASVLPFEFAELSGTLMRYLNSLRPLTPPRSRVNLREVEREIDRLAAAGRGYEAAYNGVLRQIDRVSLDELRAINQDIQRIERSLTREDGLPQRPWYRHQLYAPGYLTGYAAKTLPGVREALELRDWEQAQQQADRLAETLRSTVSEVDRVVTRMRAATR